MYYSVLDARVGVTWIGSVLPPAKVLNKDGETQGNVVKPPASSNQ